MRKILIAFLLTFGLISHAQIGQWKPFKLYIVTPDTAIIHQSLMSDIDTIEADNLSSYYASLKRMEELLNFKSYSKESESSFKEMQEDLKRQIPLMKASEERVKKFKYFQTISQYSAQIYNFYFNEYEPFSMISEITNQKTDLLSLKALADTANADYVVFYTNVHTVDIGGRLALKLTTSLYSKKENKIILRRETEGGTESWGEMWGCDMNIRLSCLLLNGVRTSSEEVANILRQRQIRTN